MSGKLTPEETEILELLAQAHNKFRVLPSQHPDEKTEWCTALHGIINMVAFRSAQRANPEVFPMLPIK